MMTSTDMDDKDDENNDDPWGHMTSFQNILDLKHDDLHDIPSEHLGTETSESPKVLFSQKMQDQTIQKCFRWVQFIFGCAFSDSCFPPIRFAL